VVVILNMENKITPLKVSILSRFIARIVFGQVWNGIQSKMENILKLNEISMNDFCICDNCPLKDEECVESEIHKNSDILFIGEAPGREEVLENRPFVGNSGDMLRPHVKKLEKMGLRISITNAVACHPPYNRTPDAKTIKCCNESLLEEIEYTDPKLIVAVGRVALKALLGSFTVHGKGITKLNGKVIHDYHIPIIAVIHPSYELRNPVSAKGMFDRGMMSVYSYFQKEPKIKYTKSKALPTAKQLHGMDIETKFKAEYVHFKEDERAPRPADGEFVCISMSDGKKSYFSYDLKKHKRALEKTPLVCHNAQYEWAWMLANGIDANIVDDTKLLAYLYDQRLSLDLESLCVYFGIDKPYKPSDKMALEGKELEVYNCRDSQNTVNLRNILWDQLTEAEKKIYLEVLLPSTKTLAAMEIEGVRVNVDQINRTQKTLVDKIKELDVEHDRYIRKFKRLSEKEFNPNSANHKRILIFDILGYEPLEFNAAYTDSGEPSTKAEVLEAMLKKRHHPTLEKIIRWSEYVSWKDKFLETLKKHVVRVGKKDFVFTSLWVGETTTGRIKSNKPNLLNCPRNFVREVFIPHEDKGLFLEVDYDQIELRIMSCWSQDEPFLDVFYDDLDPHEETAKVALGKRKVTKEERDLGKKINYLVSYGGGAGLLAFWAGIEKKDAYKFLDRFWRHHWRLRDKLDSLPEEGWVESPTGMKRFVTNSRQARNHPIQNSALVILLKAANELVPEMKRNNSPVILPVHDSFLLTLPNRSYKKTMRKVKEILESQTFDWMDIPFTVSFKVGKNWGSMEEI